MDSLSQIVLGAATFALIKDHEIGKKALLYGAILGTIPDLDVLINPFFNPIEQLSIHRAFSHSIFFAILMSFLSAKWFSYKYKTSYKSWFWASFLALFTHPLLDICTTYGTRIFYPLSKYFYSLDNIFVIDPLYTIWLLIGCVALLAMGKTNKKRLTVIRWSLSLSTLYLVFGFFIHFYATQHFESELKRQKIRYQNIKVVPTPFNTILWGAVIKTNQGFYYGYYSLFNSKNKIDFHFEKNDLIFLKKIKKIKDIEPFFNFTEGFELAREENGKMHVYGTKFGAINIENNKAEFFFPLVFNEDGTYELSQKKPNNFGKIFHKLVVRIKGN
tara:strand:+ start:96 stop:1085 length:990 start_codon:yes stop_codon:yes gene_type:complete